MGEAVPPAQTRRPLSHMATSPVQPALGRPPPNRLPATPVARAIDAPHRSPLLGFAAKPTTRPHGAGLSRTLLADRPAHDDQVPGRNPSGIDSACQASALPASRHAPVAPPAHLINVASRTCYFGLKSSRPGMADWKFPASNRQWSRVPRLAGAAQPLSHRNAPPIKSWSRLDPPPPGLAR